MFKTTVVSEVFRSSFKIYFAPFQLPIRKARGFPRRSKQKILWKVQR